MRSLPELRSPPRVSSTYVPRVTSTGAACGAKSHRRASRLARTPVSLYETLTLPRPTYVAALGSGSEIAVYPPVARPGDTRHFPFPLEAAKGSLASGSVAGPLRPAAPELDVSGPPPRTATPSPPRASPAGDEAVSGRGATASGRHSVG